MTTFITAMEGEQARGRVGGKGRSLARLRSGGFAVPDGFLITTALYRDFIAEHGLKQRILACARPRLKDNRPDFEPGAEEIRRLIERAPLAESAAQQIRDAYAALPGEGGPAVAVRSSATAEDLPDLSFAGQQETYLNVSGADALLTHVQRCWASLWTPQAISYRHQNGIDHAAVAMAVVVQIMVPSEVSGILFTANPATGERKELVVNASFGLGEAVVGGQVTPDTYIVDRATRKAAQTVLGGKEQQIVADGAQGTRLQPVAASERGTSSLSEAMLDELAGAAIRIEALYEGVPQDIEWAYSGGRLHILQSRPITGLPPQPAPADWRLPPPARYVSRRQIVENMPDPICPLFEELYLTEGLEAPRAGQNLMVGGGAMFITVNGYAYQRFDFPQVIAEAEAKGVAGVSEADIEAAELRIARSRAALREYRQAAVREADTDIGKFRADLGDADRAAFEAWLKSQDDADIKARIVMPESDNPTYVAFNNTAANDRQYGAWREKARPRLLAVGDKWRDVDPAGAADALLLGAIREMGIEEGYYWSSESSHTFGVAKSTDDQLQCFLRESLPGQNFISGQFLSGIESKTMQANADLFEIARQVRSDEALRYLVLVTPPKFLLAALRESPAAAPVLKAIDAYLDEYGHQGYSLDFIEPTQREDPSALFTSLRAMVQDESYDPADQARRTRNLRTQKLAEIGELLSGLPYWQFRFRLWLARKYNSLREEVAFLFGYTWSILRPMAFELGARLAGAGTLRRPSDVFFLVTEELTRAIEARADGRALAELGALAEERRELREVRRRHHHPPGTLPAEASELGSVSFKETQVKNDEASNVMRGFPVSSGRVSAPASVIESPAEFERMAPGSILVSPLTTPAWTQLFAQAVGLVTDVGSILAHGSIVAREYGIPAVLGVGNGTKRIRHGQTITIDGDVGTVELHEEA